jgi:N-methylhydantoinase A/oxoprolinase/acetone carboxylase beta subunit
VPETTAQAAGVAGGAATAQPGGSRYYLGIDTGGTFTDAVLLDEAKAIVASAKSLTTRFDLAVGIGASLDKLPPAMLAQVVLVSLSTTLTTNSVVEGKGAPVCVLLAGYDERQVKASGLVELLGMESIAMLPGGHDAGGAVAQPLDEAATRAAILRFAPRVSAFAISASFGVRNPEHELQLRAWVEELCDKPVACGHELASSLGAPRRAMTVALNARMVSHVKSLIDSVQRTLAVRAIDAPLMVVKGDGSLINVESALRRPVGTVLSGPAASVLGACALSGHADAIVATADSVNMIGEAAATGVPVLVFEPTGGHGKIGKFLNGLAEHGVVHRFEGNLVGERYEPLDSTRAIAGAALAAFRAHALTLKAS